MEFVNRNLLTATSQVAVGSNSTTSKNLFNWDKRLQYVSDGFNNDLTSTTITISFSSTQTVDRIALTEHNLKAFSLYYDGTTTNNFVLTSTAVTTTASFSSNSETAHYFYTTQVNCTSVSLKMDSTIEADNEKAVGVFFISSQKLDFERIPSANNYKPRFVPKQVIHRMSDGGTRQHRSHDKWRVDLKFTDITLAFRNSLRSIYDDAQSYVYVPFGTSTGWDGVIFDAVWENDFDFYKFAENSTNQGFKGSIRLAERS